jgi:pyroglutamyl-peptidase
VDVQLAKTQVLEKIAKLLPDGIICCVMTQKQKQLSVKSNPGFDQTVL